MLVRPDQSDQLDQCLAQKIELHAKLLETGALLFRGFAGLHPLAFAKFAEEFSGRPVQSYAGGASARRKIVDGVYTSTEYPKTLELSLHNELSYSHRWPRLLFFTCTTAPQEGGETPIADSRRLLKRIAPQVVSEFSKKQIRYIRRLPSGTNDGYSWEEAFETGDRAVVETYCAEGNVHFYWKDNGSLELWQTRSATAIHPLTGDKVWFNQADGFHSGGNKQSRLDAVFGDSTKIGEDALAEIRHAMAVETTLIKWQAGDILVLDNVLTAHGRRPFTGPRSILLTMT
jgi:alpha-ketoglutarate-dependent taurine dioxygenase